jgi:seryl-tRNA synthetase
MSNIVYIGIGIAAIVGILMYLGVWGKLVGTAKEKANQGIDGATNAVEKKRIRIRTLKPLLEGLGTQMSDLDGKFGRANGDVTRAQTALDAAVAEMRNIQAAIADQNNMTDDEKQTLSKKVAAVREAKALVEAKKSAVAGLAEQAKSLHDQYADAETEFNKLLADIPAAEAKQIVIDSKNTAVEFAKKQKEFAEAAKMGGDEDGLQDEQMAKADAELKRAGGGKSDTERKAEQLARSNADADILAEFGKK